MKKIEIFLIITLIGALAPSGMAQLADKAEIGTIKNDYLGLKPASKPFSLIDLSKIKWSNSYSMSFFSGGGNSGSVGLYTGLISYEFSSALTLGLKLGIAHDPAALFNRQANSSTAFLPGFSLDYHPSEHFRFSIGMDSYGGAGFYPYRPYRNNGNLLWR